MEFQIHVMCETHADRGEGVYASRMKSQIFRTLALAWLPPSPLYTQPPIK